MFLCYSRGSGDILSNWRSLRLPFSLQSEGLVKFLIEHEDNTFYQNTAEHPQKARDVPLRGRKELMEAPVLPPIVLYKTRDVLLGGCQIIVGGTCIIFSGLVSADGVEEEVWFHLSMEVNNECIEWGQKFPEHKYVGCNVEARLYPGHEHEIQPEAPGMARSAEKWLVPPEKAGDIIEVLRLRGGGGPVRPFAVIQIKWPNRGVTSKPPQILP
ncbi:hypothetical protein DFH08DRAFT_821321 [Mycena albidolilacea]|uniref:Uncharacterized protein n=1 Tax=Mycena albidolilacea TaxID=1033008 RepID=A0AAD7EEB4_9AGAR|nr:hypothetical protein DFH08DRAFT_821321 [Mycena albidolilacea]